MPEDFTNLTMSSMDHKLSENIDYNHIVSHFAEMKENSFTL